MGLFHACKTVAYLLSNETDSCPIFALLDSLFKSHERCSPLLFVFFLSLLMKFSTTTRRKSLTPAAAPNIKWWLAFHADLCAAVSKRLHEGVVST